ncbi:hypothetical protein GCM10016455_14600 [Aliiroseovarius zhejiangensis]|uniref:Uncharacterized protein n=1 Tax=Aliiroseovarius zhejiangensis TaxID=1632025 RepID=A0ABQ3IUM3_9RHOB|nr:hypothetical protein [Aliiroseovarius zhejiangensis]GHE95129.1 hypothetical protein GCM10016455_14600 [Aliiroseovarius zhejiangensis]
MTIHTRNTARAVDLSVRETSDTYRAELFRMGKYRVIVCRQGLQWVLQKQRFKTSVLGAAWRNIGYCTTKEALIRLQQAYNAPQHPFMDALPARFACEVRQ